MEAQKRGLISCEAASLWPSEYCDCSAEAACEFIFGNLETWDDAARADRRFPDKSYLREVALEWHSCRAVGRPLHILKSRRMLVSWFCSALELHLAGLVGARKYEGPNGARQFVWRVGYLYDRLRVLRPDWALPEAKKYGSWAAGELDRLVLANGSVFEAINSEGESFRGAGATVARVEELSQFAHVASLWGQALTVVQGSAGSVGGYAYSISNASADEGYRGLVS